MPKIPSSSKASSSKPRHTPLHVALNEDQHLERFGRVSRPGKRVGTKQRDQRDDDDDEPRTETSRMSQKILDLARDQQDEVSRELGDDAEEAEDQEGSEDQAESSSRIRIPTHPIRKNEDEESDDDLPPDAGSDEEEEEYLELEIDPEDHRTLDALTRGTALPQTLFSVSTAALDSELGGGMGELEGALDGGRTLADVIFEKMGEVASDSVGTGLVGKKELQSGGPPDPRQGLNPKVVEVYTKVGFLLSRYKSGPLPRALKILPSLPHWAQLLSLTAPPKWTPHATLACTKIFVSNLKPEEVRVYLQGVLLEKVRDNVRDGAAQKKKGGGGKLDVQLYEALKKGLYKPAAFFKGILFPLCEGGCSLKEATIVASVLSKISVPVLHSAAALLRLASMEYTGPNSLFIRVLLDKKYALPYKVVDGLVFHFIRLANSQRSKDGDDKLPVLWHQSLLVFVQRYGADLTPDQKDALLDVIRARPHAQISTEIRREIVSSVVRGEPRPEDGVDEDILMH